jgi:hypothetical protein
MDTHGDLIAMPMRHQERRALSLRAELHRHHPGEFRGVDSKKIRRRLLALARRGKMARPLKKRRCEV